MFPRELIENNIIPTNQRKFSFAMQKLANIEISLITLHQIIRSTTYGTILKNNMHIL